MEQTSPEPNTALRLLSLQTHSHVHLVYRHCHQATDFAIAAVSRRLLSLQTHSHVHLVYRHCHQATDLQLQQWVTTSMEGRYKNVVREAVHTERMLNTT